jgi:hypothetical protein
MTYIVQCIGCGRTRDWDRSELPDGPGTCGGGRWCWNKYPKDFPTWRVVKEHLGRGHAYVL